MTAQIEVSPKAARIIEGLKANAAALNLTLEAYLERVINAVPLIQTNEERKALEERPLAELLDGLVGVIDSSVPDPDPAAQPRRTAFGAHLLQEYRKQIEKLS